jgi:hypothetical protein
MLRQLTDILPGHLTGHSIVCLRIKIGYPGFKCHGTIDFTASEYCSMVWIVLISNILDAARLPSVLCLDSSSGCPLGAGHLTLVPFIARMVADK